jgi:uncharacterized protein (TIGR03083 family)
VVGAVPPALARLAFVEVSEHLARLRADGEQLAGAAGRARLEAPIPTCPAWTMRDLLRHVGDVHRWAATHVREGRLRPIGRDELVEIAGPLPEDDALLEWFRTGHRGLVEALEAAGPDLRCWTFLPAPSPLAFWARRQAHETAVHRADAEGASGSITPVPAPFAADGLDELLLGFFGRPFGEGNDRPPAGSLHLHAEDLGRDWLLRIGPEAVRTSAEAGPADCVVRGTASDLYLLAWNRLEADRLDVRGDRSILDGWRRNAAITWSRERA